MEGKLPQGLALVVPDNGQKKACRSCRHLVGDRCALMGELAKIDKPADMVCGYWLSRYPIEPELAGLATVPGGTCCGNCARWKKQDESCGLVEGTLHAFNCCALWEKRSTPDSNRKP